MTEIIFESLYTRLRARVTPGKYRGTWRCHFTFRQVRDEDYEREIVLQDEVMAYQVADYYVNGLPYTDLKRIWKPKLTCAIK